MCWVISAIGLRAGSSRIFRRGRLAVDQDAAAGRGVRIGEQLDVVDKRGLARAGRPDDADHVAHFKVNAIDRIRGTVTAVTTKDGDLLDGALP